MNERELKELLTGMHEFLNEKHTREQALEFLVGAGICNPDGSLANPYKN
jgi:hypothetical protein